MSSANSIDELVQITPPNREGRAFNNRMRYGGSYKVIGIYTIINVTNGRQYVGSSNDIANRWRVHRTRLNAGTHPAKELVRDWNVYGEEKFKFEVLYQVPDGAFDEDALHKLEQQYIDSLKPAYNTLPTAGDWTGHSHSDEARSKMSEAAKVRHSRERASYGTYDIELDESEE